MKNQMKKETEAALVARRTKEVELAKVLSSPQAKARRTRNLNRVKTKLEAAKAARQAAEDQVRIAPIFNEKESKRLAKVPMAEQVAAINTLGKPAKASKRQAEPKASAPRQRAGEWFFGQDGKEAFGPFTSQMEALKDARKRWPKHADRLNRRLSRFVRIGVWINTAKLASGERLKWYATTREGNEGLFNLPKPKAAK